MYDILVLGGGPAGSTAALRARELGASVALVERDRMGGTCTNDGCVPTRVLAKAARLARDAEQFDQYGLYCPPPDLDLGRLLSRTQQVVYRVQEKKQLIGNLEQAGVDVFAGVGNAHFIDPHTVALPDGRQLQGEQIILAVGGHARRLPFPGSEYTLTHSDVWQLTDVPDSVAIVGGAATGCQLATIFNALGAKVTLFDVAKTILGTEDEEVATTITEAFRRRGISVVTGINGIDSVERHASGLALNFRQYREPQSLFASAVILAVGWVGNVESLNLEAAGVRVERGYVVSDDTLRTTVPHIYAVGDVNGRMMLVQGAAHEARIAVENALLDQSRSFYHEIVPHGGFTDPEYGSVGLTEEQAHANHDCVVITVPYADLDRAVIDGRTEGFCKLIVSRDTARILGAHVVGEQALEVVQIAAAGMASGMHISQLAELEMAYPTFTGIIGLVARRVVRELNLTPISPEWQSLRRVERQFAEWERAV